MKNADPTIERLLAGLRDAEPQPGIERRILETMQAREAARFSFVTWLRQQRFPAFAISRASAMVITAAIVAIVLNHWRIPAKVIHPPAVAVQRKSSAAEIRQPARVPARLSASRVRSKHNRTMVPDHHASSFPAPPLPLTEQERLLLRVVHRRNPEDTAMLDSKVRAVQSAKANEQFQQFFGMNATEMRSQIE